jgi:hypothetical protein
MNRIKAQRQWTEFEVAQLKRLRLAGLTYAEIGAKLDRSVSAIGAAVWTYDLRSLKKPIRRSDIEWIRSLAARGYSDRVIGLTVGRTRTAVSQIRDRNQIPAGRGVKTAWRIAS